MMIPRKHDLTKQMLKRAARSRREHGMALLFTLCILSMALITAMIFSSNASTGRKVAAAHVDSSAARILADGVVNRAMLALMQSENASYACSNFNTDPPTNGNANEYASDWIWKLEKKDLFSFDKGPLRFNSTYYDRTDPRCPSWEYVYARQYGDTANDRIYGRYAYVAIGMNDQLNPNALGRVYNDPEFKSYMDAMSGNSRRLGRWTCEPQFIFKSSRNGWNFTQAISPEKIRDKYTTNDWTDLDLFINDMITEGGSDANKQHLKMMVDQYFDVSGEAEYNKFRADGNPVGDLTTYGLGSGESYRFPIIRDDWGSITVDAVKGAIPWFGNANSSQANVNQTVANLINYNASESRDPVTDNDNWISGNPTYTGNKRTPYINEVLAEVSVGGNLGLRRQEPYLEEGNPNTKWRVWYSDCSYSHEITISVETVNMYDGSIGVGAPVLIGEISYEYWNPNGDNPGFWTTETYQVNAETQWEVSQSGSGGYNVCTFMLDNHNVGSVTTPKRDGYDRPLGHGADFYEHIKVRNVRFRLDRVVLRDATGHNADLALMPPRMQTGIVSAVNRDWIVAGDGDNSRHFFCDTQVNDPRHNLPRDQWSNPSASLSETESGVNATLGSRNNTINTGSYHDNERDYEPAYNGGSSMSTAYIRHGQMVSLWELGAIHRGAPWQTINLKCAPSRGTSMESYQNGDGHLLDQVALARSTDRGSDAMIGLINLNCVANFGGNSAPFTFKSLFTNFPIYQTYANLNNNNAAGGTIRGDSVDSDNSGADDYAEELSEAVTYAIAHGNLMRRTAVFPTSFPAAGQMEKIIPSGVPDAQSEEIFCRVVNLLKWNKQQLRRATILVLAQTIKDVGGVSLEKAFPTDNDTEIWRDSGYRPFDTTKSGRTVPTTVTVSSLRSTYAKRSVAFKQYDNFYDQITGEAKIIVRLEWDASANDNKGAWKVTRKEYAE